MVEPFLLKIGYMSRTPSGRKATQLTYQHFKLQPGHGTLPGPLQPILTVNPQAANRVTCRK